MTRFMKFFLLICATAGFAIAPSPAAAKKKPELTPMELQALQSKEFETSKQKLFEAVMTVVQDLGYQVQSADLNTGFITAVSLTEQKTSFFEALGGASSTANTKMTAYVQSLPNGMARIRINFLFARMTSSAYGQANLNEKPILDPAVYRNAWDKIDEALFVMGALESNESKSAPAPAQSQAAPTLVPATEPIQPNQ